MDNRDEIVNETLEKVRRFIIERHTQNCKGMSRGSVIKRASDKAELIAFEIGMIADGEQPYRDEFDGLKECTHLYGYDP